MKRVGLFLLFVCAGCIDSTSVQRGYVDHRDSCHNRAESRFREYHPDSSAMSDKDKNNALLALFSECMKGHDWKVAGAAKEKEAAKPAAAIAMPYAPPPGYALVPVAPMQLVPAAPAAAAHTPAAVPHNAAVYTPKTPPETGAALTPVDRQGEAELERIIGKDTQ